MKKKEKLRLKIATKILTEQIQMLINGDSLDWKDLVQDAYVATDLLITSAYLERQPKQTGRIINPNRKAIEETVKEFNVPASKLMPPPEITYPATIQEIENFEKCYTERLTEAAQRLETEKAVQPEIKNKITEGIANSELQAKFLSLLNHPCFTQDEKDKAVEKSKTYDDAAYRRGIDWLNAKRIERISDNSPVSWDWNLASQLEELAKHKKLTAPEKKAVKAALEECTISQGKNILLDYNNRLDSRK